MIMKRISGFLFRSLGVATMAAAMSACVTAPPEEPWQDVGSFAWPTELGTTMRYKLASATLKAGDTTLVTVLAGASDVTHEGKAMFRLNTNSLADTTTGRNPNLQMHFFPTKDTLFVKNTLMQENGLKATYALVAPLDRGASWIATYDSRDALTPTVRATVIERYNYWKLEGKGYENVVAVKYELINSTERTEWIRFYAQGVGVILTVKNVYPSTNYTTQTPPAEMDRYTLMETTPAN